MKIQLQVEGMVCTGCENRVKNALSMLDGVTLVDANYESGIVIVEGNKNIEKEVIDKIEDLGFSVVSIK